MEGFAHFHFLNIYKKKCLYKIPRNTISSSPKHSRTLRHLAFSFSSVFFFSLLRMIYIYANIYIYIFIYYNFNEYSEYSVVLRGSFIEETRHNLEYIHFFLYFEKKKNFCGGSGG